MAIVFPFGNYWFPKSHDGRFVSFITDAIVYIDDRLRFEWKPLLAAGGRPTINIPLLLQQTLDHYRINAQRLDPRLYRVLWHIAGRLTEVASDGPRSLESVGNNTERFIIHFTDGVLATNRVIEEEWKPAYGRGEHFSMDVGQVLRDFWADRQITPYRLPRILRDLYSGAESALYDVRGWKIYDNPFGPHRLAVGVSS